MKINGQIPIYKFYKFFSENVHATNFMKGNVFFGRQKYYQNRYEDDVRNDSTESIGQCGPNIASLSLQEHYIFCASKCTDANNIQELRKRFGKDNKPANYAEIYDVKTFTDVIFLAFLNSKYSSYILDLQWYEVEYSKNYPREMFGSHPDPALSVYQKPENKEIVDEVRNNKTGELIPKEQFERVISMKLDINSVKKLFPESEYTIKTSIIKNYSIENEWRLVATIKRTSKEKQKGPFSLEGDEKLEQIYRCSEYPKKKLKKMPRKVHSKHLWKNKIMITEAGSVKNCAKILS